MSDDGDPKTYKAVEQFVVLDFKDAPNAIYTYSVYSGGSQESPSDDSKEKEVDEGTNE